ncbi:hypothetical protein DYB38_003869 [Aphanomyces astaci]|uniref:1-phosphatidylinositol-3-phosphate 5-kinase n=1 Tax=Aphanomyces astaci TaxID=112090 RepID=A0A397E778_APHAT|nr:hypothetical protein DYB38_003869 [Aphanomyces astaci]
MDCGIFGQCFPRQSTHSPAGGDSLERRVGFRFGGFDSQTKIPDLTISLPLSAPIVTYGMTFRRAPSHLQTRYWCQVDKVEVGSEAEATGVASGAVLVEFDLMNLKNVHYDDVLSRLKQAQSHPSGGVSLIFSQPSSSEARKPSVVPSSSGPKWPVSATTLDEPLEGRARTNSTMTQFWMSDQHAKCCVACDALFTFCRRRHHCRSCGQIFCSACCHRLPLSFKPRDASMHWLRNQLVCRKCHRQLKEGLLHQPAAAPSTTISTYRRNYPILGYPQQPAPPPSTPKLVADAPTASPALSSLSETAEPNQFLQDINPALYAMFPKAVMVPPVPVKAPSSAAVFHPVFPHYSAKAALPTLRRCGSDPDLLHPPSHRHHVRFRGLFADDDSSVDLDMDTSSHRPRGTHPSVGNFSRPHHPHPTRIPVASYPASDAMTRFVRDGSYQLSQSCTKASEVPAVQTAAAAHRASMADHATAFILDRIRSMLGATPLPGLSDRCAFVDILLSLSTHAASAVEDGVAGCRIKCFPGGSPSDSFVVPGVLLRKRMARKSMRPSVEFPRVLVIASALDYHKDKESFSPLEHVAGLETEYMRIAAEKIKRLRPDVVVFQRHVHRVAEECLAASDVVVVKNIKAEDLTRIARVTGAAVLTAFDHVDKMTSEAILGTCRRFRVWTPDPPEPSSHSSTRKSRKQCVVFETDSPALGVTLGLRGAASKAVLMALREIVVQAVHVGYHLRLQRSLMTAWGIIPPLQTSHSFSPTFDSMYLTLRENSPSQRAFQSLQRLKCPNCKVADAKSTRRRSSGNVRRHLLPSSGGDPPCTCPASVTSRPVLSGTQLVVSTCWSRLDTLAPSVAEWNVLQFYNADGDCSLGQFLAKYCFDTAAAVFRTAFKTHQLSFTHDVGRVHIRVLVQPAQRKQKKAAAGDMLVDMVNCAKNAVQSSSTGVPITWVSGPEPDQAAPVYVDMTPDMLAYSFGKFLEDLLYMRTLPTTSLAVSTDEYIRYFALADVVVAVAVERIEPVATVTLSPTLWHESSRGSVAVDEFEDLVQLAEQVREMTLQKIDDALVDLSVMQQTKQLHTRELPKSMDKLATLRGSVRFWCLSLSQKVRESPPVDAFARHALFREIYQHAARMCVELRDSTSTQSTFRQGSEADTNNALPTWWFQQMAAAEEQHPDRTKRASVDSTASVAEFVHRVNKGEYDSPLLDDNQGGFSAVVSTGITFFDSSVDYPMHDALSSQSNSLSHSESSWNRTLVVGSDVPKLGMTKSSHFLELPPALLQWHPSLPPGVDGVVVLVNPSQPTSVVAYSLCSVEYTTQLKDWFVSHDDHLSRPHLLAMLTSDQRSNIEHLFVDDSEFQSATKFGCKSFYATQFHALRQMIEYDERRFVESLCTCETWQVSGGKSGAGFMKTKDQRFLAKVIPSNQMQMFLNVAPKYFEYMGKSIDEGSPTMLSKIVGAYRISIGDATMNLLVMENLVYGRHVDVLFDLKGKMEGRSVADEGGGAVLWDRNFVKMCGGIPMPMHEAAMEVLKTAMLNDSTFLASVDVVDYSMLLGYDRQKQEVVVCIIDYIVKYDLLKRLEHHGKRLLQDEGEITVLNPKQYTKRFQTAMTKYFTPIPSRYSPILPRHDNDM